MTRAEKGSRKVRKGGREIRDYCLRLATRFGSALAEGTIVDAFMTCNAIMAAARMLTALYAEKATVNTLQPAKLDAGS
jgi:hypothetical protein